jgi:DNA-directed RNA polymerase specialized sigma24 family protein
MTDFNLDSDISRNISDLKKGDPGAAEDLWNRYFDQLVNLARNQLKTAPRRSSDEEDVALSVFHSLCRSAEAGRLEQLQDRTELWKLLVAMTQRKVVDHIRHHKRAKRGGGMVRGESMWQGQTDNSCLGGIEEFGDEMHSAEFLYELQEQHEKLMVALANDTLRQVAAAKMEGFTSTEIAAQLGLSVRSIERKMQLIRQCWESVLADS